MDAWTSTLERLDAQGLKRTLRTVAPDAASSPDGVVNLASNDYLGLATDPRVVEAANEAAVRYGVGAGASRLVTGTSPVHEALEDELAAARSCEAALVFASGYATNVGVLQTLASRRDVIVADALCHASLLDGARLSGARLVRYRHNDLDDLDARLAAHADAAHRFIVTEGVFSMEGDLADLTSIAERAQRVGATLIVDDAHGTAIAGPAGRGSVAAADLSSEQVPVQIGTLSKALGAQGGYVAGDRALIDLLIQKARSFVYSTGLSPALAEAARTSLRLALEEPWRREQRSANAARLREALGQTGATVAGDEAAPMLLAVVGEASTAVDLAHSLEAAGVLAPAIRPPTVPEGTSRIRFAPKATHTDEQMTIACNAIDEAFGR